EVIMTTLKPVQISQLQRAYLREQFIAEKLFQRLRHMLNCLNEYPVFPLRNLQRHETILRAIEIADSGKIRSAFQFTFERVGPTVIRTTKLRRLARRFGHHSRRVMTANVEEPAQHTITSAHDHDWFAGDVRRDVPARLSDLIRASRELP